MNPYLQVLFVLVETSQPGNVGSAARALRTMGFSRLALVRPREAEVARHPEAIAFASGAVEVLENAWICESVDEALADCTLSVALTARPREFGPQRSDPRAIAALAAAMLRESVAEMVAEAASGAAADGGAVPEAGRGAAATIAFVFGNERYGLPNEVVERCTRVVHIPANPEYSSLNLAQAVQVLAYEMRMALLDGTPAVTPAAGEVGFAGEAAPAAQIEGMFGHLEEALIATGFLDPASPKRLMPRLRRLFSRTGLEVEEVNILRGIARRMLELARR